MDIQAILDASSSSSAASSASSSSLNRNDNDYNEASAVDQHRRGTTSGYARPHPRSSSYPARNLSFGDENSHQNNDDDNDASIRRNNNESLTTDEGEGEDEKKDHHQHQHHQHYANAYAKALNNTNAEYHNPLFSSINHKKTASTADHHNHHTYTPTHAPTSSSLGAVDLEQILREDDDDDLLNHHRRRRHNDDDDSDTLDDDDDSGPRGSSSYGISTWRQPLAAPSPLSQRSGGGGGGGGMMMSGGSTNLSTSAGSSRSSYAPVTSATGEDWDVLQAILGEDDGDDDDDDDDDDEEDDRHLYSNVLGAEGSEKDAMTMLMMKMTAGSSSSIAGSHHRNGSGSVSASGGYYDYNGEWKTVSLPDSSSVSVTNSYHHHRRNSSRAVRVDAILQQSDDEADFDDYDDDAHHLLVDGGGGGFLSSQSPIQPSRNWSGGAVDTTNTSSTLEPTESFATAVQSEPSGNSVDQLESSSHNNQQQQHQPHYSLSIVPTSSSLDAVASLPNQHYPATNTTGSSDWDLEKASRKSLQYAQAYERKLLKSGHRDIVSPLMVKRRLKPKIELNTKQQQQQRLQLLQQQQQHDDGAHVSTPISTRLFTNTPKNSNIHNTSVRFGFSGAVETKQMENVSLTLLKNMPDLPTALCINSRFIAIGTQKGEILTFDLFETFRKRLVHGGDTPFNVKTAGSVTTIDLSLVQGDVLAAGYTSGYIVLWDVIKGVALRTVIESHNPSPITNVRFLNELKLVSVDAGGLVHKLAFSKNILWSSYSVESECLLDGTAGQILATNVLPPYSAVHQQLPLATPAMKKIVLLALSSERSSFAVAVEPTVHVLHRWAKPTEEQMAPADDFGTPRGLRNNSSSSSDQIYLPCLAWGWALVSGGGNAATPTLARAWGCSMQLLRASFQEEDPDAPSAEVFPWPAFGVQDEFKSSAPVVALEWLNDRSLVYLTVTNEFVVVDTVMMTLLERLDFSGLHLVYAEFSLSRKAETDESNNFCTTFQNSVRSCDNRLLLLCQEELKSVSIVGAKRRISALEQDGEWLEALASALDHYENTVSSQQDRRRDPQGRKDLSKHPEYASITKSEDEEWIAKLLTRYITIAVENAPELTEFELAQSHFQMLAGVCVEFCVVTKRLDMLFGSIFRRFHAAGFASVFLDVLEPYILNDKLDYIAPEAMAHFVEHCRTTNGIATVERCLLHMDVTIMDFDSILSLLRANEMYSALFYVFNQGLHDFTTPLEILLEKIFDSADTTNHKLAKSDRRKDGAPRNDMERFGYKAILYLQYCFKGRTFPQDNEIEDEERIGFIRSQLLRFLLQKRFSPSPSIRKQAKVVGQRAQKYPYTHILLMVDPKSTLDALSLAMDAPDSDFGRDSSFESIQGWEVEVGAERANGRDSHTKAPDRQEIIGMLLSIIMPESDDTTKAQLSSLHGSQNAINALLDFLAEYLMKGVVRANKTVTFMILNRMAARFESATDPQDRLQSQKQILQLLTALPRNSYEPEEVLLLVQKSGIHRAALLLHQEGASSWGRSESQQELEHRAAHFRAAIDCYLDDDDLGFRKEVFAYVKKECSGASDSDEGSDGEPKPNALRDALASKLADLVQLDSLLTAELVAELFVEDLDRVIKQLDDENAQFLFFQAIISGDLDAKDQVAGAVLNANLTMEHHHKYLALMAKLHPDDVYDYLQNHDNYRPEACLPLCQKYDIADASCYLLERMGNVSSGLQLILQTLESRMMGLKRTIRGMGTEFHNKYSAPRHPALPWKKRDHRHNTEAFDITEREIDGVKRVLIVALDLCERNSGTFSSRTEHGSQLWFNVLDRLINAKGFLRLSKEQPGHAKVMAGVLSELLRLTMQRMVSSVPLPDLVRKVTSDHSGSRLGELREMVESLLSTYGFELNVFSGAVNVFHHDAREMQHQHRALRIEGAIVRKILNVPLNDTTNLQAHRVLVESSVREGDVLQLGEAGNASLVDADGATKTSSSSSAFSGEQGLGNALSKLRSRRRPNNTTSSTRSRAATTSTPHGLNFMTDQEKWYSQGEIDPDATYFEDRVGGLLGDAEHRGRLMSFTY